MTPREEFSLVLIDNESQGNKAYFLIEAGMRFGNHQKPGKIGGGLGAGRLGGWGSAGVFAIEAIQIAPKCISRKKIKDNYIALF